MSIFGDKIMIILLIMALYVWHEDRKFDIEEKSNQSYMDGKDDTCEKIKDYKNDIYLDLKAHDICY